MWKRHRRKASGTSRVVLTNRRHSPLPRKRGHVSSARASTSVSTHDTRHKTHDTRHTTHEHAYRRSYSGGARQDRGHSEVRSRAISEFHKTPPRHARRKHQVSQHTHDSPLERALHSYPRPVRKHVQPALLPVKLVARSLCPLDVCACAYACACACGTSCGGSTCCEVNWRTHRRAIWPRSASVPVVRGSVAPGRIVHAGRNAASR